MVVGVGWGRKACLTQLKDKELFFAQADKEKLQDEVGKLSQEKALAELKLRSCETEKTQLAPTLEEAQWEVRPI